MTSLALRTVDDVSYETRITHEIYFEWEVEYLVKLEDDS